MTNDRIREIETVEELKELEAQSEVIRAFESMIKQGLSFYIRLDEYDNIVETDNAREMLEHR